VPSVWSSAAWPVEPPLFAVVWLAMAFVAHRRNDVALANADPRPHKIDVGVGVYRDAEALAEVPSFDTGAWSLYQPGLEDTLGYHQLVTGFLQQLCTRTAAPVYCTTATHFQADLTTPPGLSLLTHRARIHRPTSIRFQLSKVSHVGIVVLAANSTAYSTSATFVHGVGAFSIPPLKRPGLYTVQLAATDLAGNFNRITGTVSVSR